MFTPPPSPQPKLIDPLDTLTTPDAPAPSTSRTKAKQRTARRTRWAVLAVPLVVVLITFSSRYLTHPAAFDILSEPASSSWQALVARGADWSIHKRHPEPDPQANIAGVATPTSSVGAASPSSSMAAANDASVPKIPSSDVSSTLPTPFPQPFDGTLTQNFSSTSCFSFFNNMTNTLPFRTCRPFSLLQQSSSQFLNAQQNLTLMNTLIWGTCNTTPSFDQCVSNMGWFADTLKSACAQDLKDQNTMAVDTLLALQAYGLMRNTACLSDPTTSTYCYLNAVSSSNPSDLYYYTLPLDIGLPKTAKPSCAACTQSVMTLYASALRNTTQAEDLSGLKDTYESAAEQSVQVCGSGYAQTAVVNAGGRRVVFHGALSLVLSLTVVILVAS
ncbi:hypothetical protein BDQ12DRAFT_120550 [Crucibulum laeve]|uniref:DUF7729 domain-containing protein n=1 Tax=Crucibulum laeve TaxID=68775 RepID=A0A5C3LZE5_9AGAR|nr:hypothetical protein BDQ12DRAFT_120550 [Crucibulum laeve]